MKQLPPDTPEQSLITQYKGPRLVVKAYAGTGKTTTLVKYAHTLYDAIQSKKSLGLTLRSQQLIGAKGWSGTLFSSMTTFRMSWTQSSTQWPVTMK